MNCIKTSHHAKKRSWVDGGGEVKNESTVRRNGRYLSTVETLFMKLNS